MDQIVEADSPTLIKAYKTQVQKLDVQRLKLAGVLSNQGRPLASFDAVYRTAGIAEPFRLLGDLNVRKYGLVEPDGIEPTTSTMPL